MWYTRAQHKKRIKTRRMLDEPGSTAINDGVEVAPAPEIPPMDLQPSAPPGQCQQPSLLTTPTPRPTHLMDQQLRLQRTT